MDILQALAATRLPLAERRHWLKNPSLFPVEFSARDLQSAERVLASVQAAGQEVLLFDDPRYPQALRELPDAPPLLFARGRLDLLDGPPRMSVVGSRRGTERARLCAERLGMELARAGVVVVSGLALGIDGEAHRGALAVGGDCIGVVATGLDLCHPSSHRRLHEEVLRTGLLLSEYPPSTPARPWAFVARNRILAAVGSALVVVEAGAKSGALTTVDFALQLGREVLCYPGPVDSVSCQGSLSLLRQGAQLVRHGADVLESMGWTPPRRRAVDPLGLGNGEESAEEIARRMGRSLGEVLSELAELESEGRVRRSPGGRWRVTS